MEAVANLFNEAVRGRTRGLTVTFYLIRYFAIYWFAACIGAIAVTFFAMIKSRPDLATAFVVTLMALVGVVYSTVWQRKSN